MPVASVWGHCGTDQYHVRSWSVQRVTPTCEITAEEQQSLAVLKGDFDQ